MTVFIPDVPEDEIQSTIDQVIEYITAATGEIIEVNRDSPWGRRRLAYPIRHASRDVRDGFYTLYHFSVAPHLVEDIERELRLNDRVMRYLVTQYTPRPIAEMEQTEETEETVSAPAGADEPVTASAAAEPATEEAAPADAEAPAIEAAPEQVTDVAEGEAATTSEDDKAGPEEAARPEEA